MMNYKKIKKIITSFLSYSQLPFFNNTILKKKLLNSGRKKELYNTYKIEFSPKKLVEENKISVLQKIYEDVEDIYKTLTPLIELGIPMSIDVVGGAPRDYIFNKKISDLDIFVSYSVPSQEVLVESLIAIIPQEKRKEYIEADILDDMDLISIMPNVILYLMKNKDNEEEHQFFPLSEKYEETFYGQNLINVLDAVIKTKNKNGNYPIDILVSYYDRDTLLKSMDLNICKTGICFFDNKEGNKGFPELNVRFPLFNEVPQRFYTSENFLIDLTDKTITFDNEFKTEKQIEYTLFKHLPKVIQKYPSFPVKIDIENTDLEMSIKAITTHNNLENKLEVKIPTTKVRKL